MHSYFNNPAFLANSNGRPQARYRILIVVLVFYASTIPGVSANQIEERVISWIEENIPEFMREARMPGFAIAVTRNRETIYANGFGARDLNKGLPATADTLFGIGSITKSFVAISILQLAEKGKLNLDDPVSEYISFKLGIPGKPITIRHLLTHSSGIPNLNTSGILVSKVFDDEFGVPMASSDDFFRFVNEAQSEVLFESGERFFYNNAAWRLLGAIIQEVSGMPFHEYVTANVIRPLGMERTTFDTDRLYKDPNHLIPHQQSDSGPKPSAFPYQNPADNPEFSFLSAAGGISSSVNEMVRYLKALINLGRHESGRLISQSAMEEMQTLHTSRREGYYGTIGYGYGLQVVSDFLGEKLVDHGGSIKNVSTARISLIPNRNIGVVMMGNSGGMDYETIAESVLAILMGKDPDYRDGHFYTLNEGLNTAVEFRFGDNGDVTLLIERWAYHKKN